MPPGRAEKWLSPAFEPTERGGRLYGRGTADDKAGVMAHLAAVASFLGANGSVPCNVKFIIEGEEEIGSRNLGRFLEQYRAKMAADFIVLTDTRNYDVGHPALVYQLRGLCKVDVEVQGLHQPLHSGNSGPVPDPVQILCALIADLRKPNGALNVPGLYARVARPSAKQLARIRKLPLSEAKFKKDSGMLPGVRLWGESQFSLLERNARGDGPERAARPLPGPRRGGDRRGGADRHSDMQRTNDRQDRGAREPGAFPGFRELAERRRQLVVDLVARRPELGLSQTAIAARMGTSQLSVARLESGAADVRLTTLERYAAALGWQLGRATRPGQVPLLRVLSGRARRGRGQHTG